MKRGNTIVRYVSVAILCAACAGQAGADTLADTLAKAYQLSPSLQAAQAALRALDEQVGQAKAGKRPQVNMEFGVTTGISEPQNSFRPVDPTDPFGDLEEFEPNTVARSRQINARISTTLNLFDAGRTKAAVNAANASVSAGRASLKNAEQNLLLNAVTAFMDVRRDIRFVSLAESNVSVLGQQVRAARDRFELGEVTRTDVSLAEARLAQARASLASFRGQLTVSQEQFRAVVGVPPENLQAPPPIPALPASLEQAISIAMRESPDMIAIRFREIAAKYNVERADANRKLTLDAGASFGVTNSGNLNIYDDLDTKASGQLSLTLRRQLYSGGALKSAIREAQAALSEQKFLVQDTARLVQRNVASAWAGLDIAQASIIANRQQVAAAQVTFDGVREEARLGARTTLDVLDREQELRDAQVQLASSIRDEYVRAYELLASMGLLTVEHLNLGVEQYDPNLYYNAVKNAPLRTPRGEKLDKLLERYR
ncbi:TolC family outer membrane protein [Algicella marina]|uniref:TolC family outer membrane protein n=1 Tax=Algicella marina TaxID=2683284 RepID=A0A6P1T4V1_9RHOB|nr:TolC family outer membrane protein [Algicella marina]QHQ35572.1 TolC family outer membrane protein [Algicella marina]